MKKLYFKTKFSTVALILVLTTSAILIALPVVSAHDPPWEISSFAYIAAQPDPVGQNQNLMIYMWVDEPMPSAAIGNDIRRHDYKLTITKPDETIETHNWDVIYDPTGIQYFTYTPDQIGTYTLQFEYAGQVFTWTDPRASAWTNDILKPASASTTVTVQEEPLVEPIYSYPLPTEYWTRPIEGQNTDWWSISSNWLNAPYIRSGATSTGGAGYGRFQPDGIGPNSPHIMWSRSIQDGGIVGELYYEVPKTYYMGGSYSTRFTGAIVMHGRLYYEEPWGNSGGGGDYICVDLRTGEELWRIDVTGEGWVGKPTFGYLYSYDTGNQHGVLPNGLLIVPGGPRGGPANWQAYDARTGRLTSWNMNNIPSGTSVAGPNGEILTYTVTNLGDATNPNWYLAQWNSSKMQGTGLSPSNWYSGTVDGSSPEMYDWNVSLNLDSGPWSIYRDVSFENLLLLTSGSFGDPRSPGTGVDIAAISLKPDSIGNILWNNYYPVRPNNESRVLIAVDAESNRFVCEDKETMRLTAFSLTDGNEVWSVLPDDALWDTMRSVTLTAYGNLYRSGFDGVLHCYDLNDGTLLWTYGNGGEGNSTYAGLQTPWGHYPLFIDVIADGKIYLGTTEHSPGSPFYKNSQYRCVDAYTGEEIWTMLGWGTGMYVGQYDIVADGFFVFLNCYDMKIYAVGKGPSAISVTTSKISSLGDSVLIEGTAIDISSGTEQNEQSARFPNGVPAVSDESMSEWMEYVYMQKPRPENVTGIPVKLAYQLPDGSWKDIDQVISDEYGNFGFKWTPEEEGTYKVKAFFLGSESYWGSSDATYLTVGPSGASAEEIADDTAQRTINMLPHYPAIPEIPAYLSIDLIILIIAAVGVVIGLIAYMALRKQK
jgi:hypothetical protein